MTPLAGHDDHAMRLLWLVVSLVGSAAILALIVIYRRAAAGHAIEEAERVIAAHDAEADVRRE